jgi:hypothetical protein
MYVVLLPASVSRCSVLGTAHASSLGLTFLCALTHAMSSSANAGMVIAVMAPMHDGLVKKAE